jgi:hypothetical protein
MGFSTRASAAAFAVKNLNYHQPFTAEPKMSNKIDCEATSKQSYRINWKHLMIGIIAGVITGNTLFKVKHNEKSPYALHFLEVQTLDADTRLPVAVGVKLPSHPDFSSRNVGPIKAILTRVEHGNKSGLTRVVWLGTTSADAYQFTLFANGYEDLSVPSDFIDTVSGVEGGALVQPEVLLMKKAERGNTGLVAPVSATQPDGGNTSEVKD